ncbi:FAD-dependent oxidoreductase [Mesoterricola sediminis]|uniref:FAD-dependent oxidoreductase n=1 Tax=Mesoterricola sediminis TaxID=2927980 RepID=A0AA48KHA6_9BACT|nr:FAD-dependent oxidoreductase [Mesoterricola sediminis]BDU78188.1 FAD-dependent oxidoreductase [Mesoterricola sediminis]
MRDMAPLPGTSFDLCVVGAGVSGLCLARAAARAGQKVIVLERRPEAGGCLSSAPVPPAGVLELGAHTCYNSYTQFLGLAEEAGFLALPSPRKGLGFRMVVGGKVRSIGSCLNVLEAAVSVPKAFWTRKEGLTVEGYYGRILGRGNWDRVLHPALNAVASQETAGFPAGALFQKRPSRRKEVLRSFAVRGGLGPAVQALAEHPGIHLAAGREAAGLARTGDGFRVRTGLGEEIAAKRVALAVPAPEAAALAAADFPGVAEVLGRIRTVTVRTLGLVLADPLPHLPRLTGLILPEGPCFSAVSGDAFPVEGKRAWSFHFRGDRDDSEAAMRAYACQVLGADPARIEAAHRRDHTMPALALGHEAWLAELDRALAGQDLLVAGNYLSGMSIEDCAGRALREWARATGA